MGEGKRLYMLGNNNWIRYVTEFIERDFPGQMLNIYTTDLQM